jgi:deazaflavin-dependent oxidoreductase (nitroreductase family)
MLFGQEHVQRYIETGGKEGHDWQGTSVLILTTTGRRTGRKHATPLIYQEHDGSYLVVASKGGSVTPPDWYLNLQADPEVEVQVWGERFAARARTATDEEKPALWRLMTRAWPAYNDYQQKTDRVIPVVVLDRVDSSG